MATGASTADVAIAADRCAQGASRARPAATRCSVACSASGMSCLAINKMDLVEWSEGSIEADRGGVPGFRGRSGFRKDRRHSLVGAAAATMSSSHRAARLVRRPDAAQSSRNCRGRAGGRLPAISHAGAVGQPAHPGVSRLRRLCHQRPCQIRRPGADSALGTGDFHCSDCDDGRRAE